MKILIAGLGSIGRRHLRNLRALGEEDILLYRTHQATLPDEELAGLPVETDLRRALDLGPAAVVVANPTALHLDVAIPAARAGCHLLMEKPISHSLERVDELAAAVEQNDCRVLVGFQFRFHPALQKAAELLGSGAIGRILSVRSQWGEYLPSWHPWEDFRQGYAARLDLGGGVILTLCQSLDYLRWLLGEVEKVWAFKSSANLGLPVEDSAEIGLQFASGAIGSAHLDYNRQPGLHQLDVVGAEGTLQWDNADGTLRLYRAASQAWETFSPPPGFERNVLFVDEMRHFLAAARGEAAPLCTLEDGRRALALALAAHESADSGKMIAFPAPAKPKRAGRSAR